MMKLILRNLSNKLKDSNCNYGRCSDMLSSEWAHYSKIDLSIKGDVAPTSRSTVYEAKTGPARWNAGPVTRPDMLMCHACNLSLRLTSWI